MLERIIDQVKLINPAEKERREAEFLADRFDTIKLHLKKLGVSASSFGSRDFDDKIITSVTLSFDKRHEQEVKDELAKAEIEEVFDTSSQLKKWMAIGMAVQFGFDKKSIKELVDKREIVIFKGKNILEKDLKRLVTLKSEKRK